MKPFLPFIFATLLVLTISSGTDAYANNSCSKFGGNAERDRLNLICNGSPPSFDTQPGERGRKGSGGSGAVTQPVPPEIETQPTFIAPVKRTSAPNIPCSSPDASNNLVLSPPDAPGVRTDRRTGQTYLCTPKTPEGQDPAPVEYTLPDGEVIEAPAPIVVNAEDFRNLGILPSTAHQERAPHTLKNYNTNFWASPQEQTFDIEMGGVPVQVRATPVSYRFDYGDGESLNTVNAGYQLGEEVWDEPTPTSHKYVQPGDYTYAVTTFYRGEFSVAGGPWQVIDGTGEAVSEGQLVRVWRTQVGLVADDCSADGGAWGCPGTDR